MEKPKLINEKNWVMKFELPNIKGCIFKDKNNMLEASFDGNELTISILYSVKPLPLVLKSEAIPGDQVKLVNIGFRIELYINDVIEDEEWPDGESYIDFESFEPCIVKPEFFDYEYVKEKQPSVIGHFVGAEGWKPALKINVGDCMPFCHDGRYHIFYLRDRHNHHSRWFCGGHQFAHISSEDLIHWDIHPLAVEIEDKKEGSFCTGSIIYNHNNKKFYAFYSIRMLDGSPAPICFSVSDDGYHFTKVPAKIYLSEKYRAKTVRDPKVFKDESGLFHMYVTTSIYRGEKLQGCLAHLTSTDLENFIEEDEPALLTEEYVPGTVNESIIEPECSDQFYKNGWHYLCYQGRYSMSRSPYGPWVEPENPSLDCGRVPKMAFWRDRMIFAGFVSDGRYAGTIKLAEAVQNEDGTLRFIPFDEMKL